MQKPSVGRIVLYCPLESQMAPEDKARPKGQPYPALVTHVFGENCVNLDIANDGSFPLRSPLCMTSVMLDPSDGDCTPGTWRWPQVPERPAARLTNEDLDVLVTAARRSLQHHFDPELDAQLDVISRKLKDESSKAPVKDIPEDHPSRPGPKGRKPKPTVH